MKHFIGAIVLAVTFVLGASSPAFSATEKEKAFVDAYKKAFQEKDSKTLTGFLYTKGADPQAVEFYTMMMGEFNGNITSAEISALTPEEAKKANGTMPGPDGNMTKLNVSPQWKFEVKTSDASGTATSTMLIAEVDGKLMIPVPGPAK